MLMMEEVNNINISIPAEATTQFYIPFSAFGFAPANAGHVQISPHARGGVSTTRLVQFYPGQGCVKGDSATDGKAAIRKDTSLSKGVLGPLPRLTGQLLDEVASEENLQRAWDKLCKYTRKAGGVDNQTIPAAYKRYCRDGGLQLRKALMECRYRPKVVKRVEIPKRNGGTRPLGIPTVEDRVVQTAILQVLQARLEPYFHEYSYGFRPDRSVYDATEAVKQLIREGYAWCADFDISKFFDTVDHNTLMDELRGIIEDERLSRLIEAFLKAGYYDGKKTMPTVIGVPQGGPLSPLLANVILHKLDMEAVRRGLPLIRYADDFVVLARSQRSAERICHSLSTFLKTLKLDVNREKTRVTESESLEFLGFAFNGKMTHVSQKRMDSLGKTVKYHLNRIAEGNVEGKDKLTQYVNGWLAHHTRVDDKEQIQSAGQWYRETVEACENATPETKKELASVWDGYLQRRTDRWKPHSSGYQEKRPPASL